VFFFPAGLWCPLWGFSFCAFVGFLVFVGLAYTRLFRISIYLEQFFKRRGFRSTPDGSSAVQPPGLIYKAHWEALGRALCLLTTPEISGPGPLWGRGSCPGSRRPRARVPSGVWTWDFCSRFFPAVSRPLLSTVLRSALCDCSSVNGWFPLSLSSR
jgi:hypothetical protein